MDKVQLEYNDEELRELIGRAAAAFYELVYRDAWFCRLFRNVTQAHITSQQTDFMVGAMGGPKVFSGRSPRTAHPHIWIDEAIWGHRDKLLTTAFDLAETPQDIRDKWLQIEAAFKGGIINHGGVEECVGRYRTDPIIYEPMPDHLRT